MRTASSPPTKCSTADRRPRRRRSGSVDPCLVRGLGRRRTATRPSPSPPSSELASRRPCPHKRGDRSRRELRFATTRRPGWPRSGRRSPSGVGGDQDSRRWLAPRCAARRRAREAALPPRSMSTSMNPEAARSSRRSAWTPLMRRRRRRLPVARARSGRAGGMRILVDNETPEGHESDAARSPCRVRPAWFQASAGGGMNERPSDRGRAPSGASPTGPRAGVASDHRRGCPCTASSLRSGSTRTGRSGAKGPPRRGRAQGEGAARLRRERVAAGPREGCGDRRASLQCRDTAGGAAAEIRDRDRRPAPPVALEAVHAYRCSPEGGRHEDGSRSGPLPSSR